VGSTTYGSTAFHAASTGSGVSARRYRYTSKERDEETGFYYHGARYYAPWLGRWTAADPLEFTDGINLYRYVHDNPVVMIDPAGTQAAPVVTPGTPAPTGPAVKTALERAAARWGTAKLLTEAALKAAPAAAPAAEALAGAALVQAAAQVAAYALIAHLYATRAGSIARYGNPYGLPADDIAFPLQRYERERRRHAEPKEDAYPGSDVLPEPAADRKEDDKKPQKLGRIYVTYTKYNERTKLYYSGRTSAVVDLTKPLRPQAILAVEARDRNHHKDESIEPTGAGFKRAELDKFDVGTAIDYSKRYQDVAYLAIRGREQQLIDYYGGAQSDTSPGPNKTENAIRGYSKENPFGRIFHAAANLRFKRELHPYTGTLPP
jgi:RHS repeat-associated protein